MNIKKVDDKPMVIHTKEKPKLKVKGAPETKIKGRNVLTVQHGPKIAGSVAEKSVAADGKIKLKRSSVHVTDKRKTVQTKTAADGMEYRGGNGGRKTQGRNDGGTTQGRTADRNTQDRQGKEQEVRQSVNKENRMYAQYRIAKAEKEAAVKKKPVLPSGIASVAARTALDEMEGGNEVHDAYMTAYTLAKPATNAVDAGRNLYRSQAAKATQNKLKKKQSGSRIREKAVKESAVKTARKTAQTAAKETAKETGKKAAKETSKAAARTAAATAGTRAGGVLVGTLAGEAAGIAMDKRDLKNSTRNRMIKLFVAKLRQEDNQDSIGKALKDIVLMRFSMMAKYIVRYVGLFLLALFAVVAIIALPIIAVIAVIYNSPFAVFFPSISSGETTQEVLSAYVSEFNDAVNTVTAGTITTVVPLRIMHGAVQG